MYLKLPCKEAHHFACVEAVFKLATESISKDVLGTSDVKP